MIKCDKCGGECCKKLAFNIGTPKNVIDFEDVKWYIYHKNALVYIDNEGDWMVQVPAVCSKLDKNGNCTIYDERPPICRLSKVEDCEVNTNEMNVVFKTVKDLEKYMKKKGIL